MMAHMLTCAVGLAFLGVAAWAQGGTASETEGRASVTIRWYGQAFFSLTRSDGLTVAIDPFREMGYPMPEGLAADILLVSHEHGDHNNVGLIAGQPTVLRSEQAVGSHTAKDITFMGTACFHDEEGGAKRGKNTAFSFELAGVRFCHMGDIGHLLSEEQRNSIGALDVLMVPVGGYYTIPVEKVDALIDQLDPKVVIPMHYKTEAVPKIPIAPLDEWIKDKPGVKRLESPSVTIKAADLPKTREVWVLPYQ